MSNCLDGATGQFEQDLNFLSGSACPPVLIPLWRILEAIGIGLGIWWLTDDAKNKAEAAVAKTFDPGAKEIVIMNGDGRQSTAWQQMIQIGGKSFQAIYVDNDGNGKPDERYMRNERGEVWRDRGEGWERKY